MSVGRCCREVPYFSTFKYPSSLSVPWMMWVKKVAPMTKQSEQQQQQWQLTAAAGHRLGYTMAFFLLMALPGQAWGSPASSADLSPVDMMRKFQGWVLSTSTATDHHDHDPDSGLNSSPHHHPHHHHQLNYHHLEDQDNRRHHVGNIDESGEYASAPNDAPTHEDQHHHHNHHQHHDHHEQQQQQQQEPHQQQQHFRRVPISNPRSTGLSLRDKVMTPSSSADQHAEDESDQRPAAATGATSSSSSSSSLTHPNPGAWGISDVQDQEFLASYLRDAKANFGHRLQDGEDHHHYHHREAETESEDGRRHRAAASASASAAAAAAAASSSSLYLQQGLAGFIRTPHLPATWYTAETHEPVKTGPLLERQLSDEDHHQQEEEQKDNGTLLFLVRDNNGKDDENIKDNDRRRDPKVFYSDASRRIEEHLNGGSALLAQHTLDVEADNLDVPYQEPNLGCLSYGSHFCSVQQDYPKAIMKWIDDKFATILSNFSLPSTPELEAGGPLFGADPVPPADDAPCESRRSDLQPSWVQDENTGAWVLVVQTMSLQQWIRLDECISKDISCQYVMPFYSSVCREKTSVHQLVAWNPSLPEMLSFAYLKAPNGCECHILHQHRNDEYYSDHRRR